MRALLALPLRQLLLIMVPIKPPAVALLVLLLLQLTTNVLLHVSCWCCRCLQSMPPSCCLLLTLLLSRRSLAKQNRGRGRGLWARQPVLLLLATDVLLLLLPSPLMTHQIFGICCRTESCSCCSLLLLAVDVPLLLRPDLRRLLRSLCLLQQP